MSEGVRQRRSRQAIPRPRVVQFSLTEEEYQRVTEAAARLGLARGAFAAGAALANATGQAGDDLIPAAHFCARVTARLDEAVQELRRSIP